MPQTILLSALEERLETAQEAMTDASVVMAHEIAYEVMKDAKQAFKGTTHQQDRSYRNGLDRVILGAILLQYQCFLIEQGGRTWLERLADTWDRWRLYAHAKRRISRLGTADQPIPDAWKKLKQLRHPSKPRTA